MNKHDSYEDALFSLLMAEVAETEGEKLMEENARLQDEAEFEGEDSRLHRARETINRVLHRQKRKKAAQLFKKAVGTVAVAAMLLLVVGIGSYLAIPQLRAQIQDYLIGKYTVTQEDESAEAPGKFPVSPGGTFVETKRSTEYTDGGIIETITYEDPDTGDTFSIKVFTEYTTTAPSSTTQTDEAGRILITPPPLIQPAVPDEPDESDSSVSFGDKPPTPGGIRHG